MLPTKPCVVHRNYTGNMALCDHALRWLFPWTRRSYPGFRKGVLSALPRSYTWQAVQHWRRGRRLMGADVADALADQIEALCVDGRDIIAGLRSHAAAERTKPKRLVGCCAPDPVTGWDRRGHYPR